MGFSSSLHPLLCKTSSSSCAPCLSSLVPVFPGPVLCSAPLLSLPDGQNSASLLQHSNPSGRGLRYHQRLQVGVGGQKQEGLQRRQPERVARRQPPLRRRLLLQQQAGQAAGHPRLCHGHCRPRGPRHAPEGPGGGPYSIPEALASELQDDSNNPKHGATVDHRGLCRLAARGRQLPQQQRHRHPHPGLALVVPRPHQQRHTRVHGPTGHCQLRRPEAVDQSLQAPHHPLRPASSLLLSHP
mmetsp:Transcript_9698/g.27722  ORF Transcript_9698/g.27722 Transcript_9698/m.27722 type:complete len:241 (-) Transcript_9698:1914-2636(-)